MDYKGNDYIHQTWLHSIYDRTDYINNLDMVIPHSLARGFCASVLTEPLRVTGVPQNDPRPYPNPLAGWRPYIPKGKR